MCGIAGFYGFRNDSLINKFSSELAHRGPDGVGYEIDDKVTLLSRRLAIIDRKGGQQPIYNEDKSISVVYNGEMYNYRELRLELEKKGHVFSTKSDTEVIAHGYEEWGEMCFDRFNAMFAVALYDKKKQRLILGRDHFGIKPLYYSIVNGTLDTEFLASSPRLAGPQDIASKLVSSGSLKIIFSSEIKPIINSGLIKKIPNDRIIYRYLRYRVHDDLNETFFKGVYKLLPGEMMIIQNSKIEIQKFSNLENELLNMRENVPTDKNRILSFKEHLTQAVKSRLISEVPVGTCLSGGLDSSTVVALTNQLLKEKVQEAESVGKIQKTFSAVFPGSTNDEEKYIDSVVKKVGQLQNYKVKPKPEEFFEDLKDFIRTQEEPTISTGPYAQYKVMEEAHKYVTVVLDGQGADEMMAGYLPYYFVYFRQLWKEKKLAKLIFEIIKSTDILVVQLINRLYTLTGIKRKVDIKNILNREFVSKFSSERFDVVDDNLKRRLVEDIFKNSLPALLRYEDKNSMRFSIEGRVPFLDFDLLRYLFTLDDEAIINGGWNKNILRGGVADLLPEEIVKRRNKIGFTTPEHEWFMRMKNRIYSIFLSESFSKRKYFNQSEILKQFEEFIQGKNDDTLPFWRLVNLELWLREFIDVRSIKKLKNSKINKLPYQINEGKKLEIKVGGKIYKRYPIRTEIFQKGDEYSKKIVNVISNAVRNLEGISRRNAPRNDKKWFVVVSEKIVAISQGRSYFIWDIKPGFFANLLSTFVKKTPYGIGLGSPWTMQIAIDEVGLPKIILASFLSILAKPFGLKGTFYKIAGDTVRSIDGPTEYSLYPSNVSAKLGPKDPQNAAEKIHSEIVNSKSKIKNFGGVVIIDANDLGRNVLGNTTGLENKLIEQIFKDNPMGQGSEQTPLVLVQT